MGWNTKGGGQELKNQLLNMEDTIKLASLDNFKTAFNGEVAKNLTQ